MDAWAIHVLAHPHNPDYWPASLERLQPGVPELVFGPDWRNIKNTNTLLEKMIKA